jgi:signal transduction histidine kinase
VNLSSPHSRRSGGDVTISDVNRRTFVAHGVLVIVLVTGNLWLGLNFSTLPLPGVLSEVAVAACFATAGLMAWWLRPRSRTGPWLLVLGSVALINNPFEFRMPTELPGHGLVVFVGGVATWLQYAIAGHVLLAYPSGRLTGRAERLLVTIAFILAVGGGALLLTTLTSDPATCLNWCYQSPVQLVANRGLYLHLRTAVQACWIVLVVIVMALLVRRIAHSTPRRRRVLGFALTMFALSTVFFLGMTLAVIAGGTRTPAAAFFQYSHQWIGVVALPGTFFVGLLHERLAFASVGTLVGKLQRVPTTEVEDALRKTLRDPGLRVVFPAAGNGFVDISGRSCDLPGAGTRTMTPLDDPPTVVLIHDPALTDDRELFDAAAAAARLTLDNARLQATVRAQLIDVLASRQRIAAAADSERQRLERDLHDGAQQRFLGLGMALGVLRSRLENTPERAMVNELEHELRTAIRELREVAHGIRPAVLTDQGLVPALAGLARRAAIRVTLDTRITGRLPPIIEATAYYVVSEALQNIVKHAAASNARVTAVHEAGKLTLEVIDNGTGGANTRSGTGLSGLADRVGAVGGVFEIKSPPGGGTTLRAELPCE